MTEAQIKHMVNRFLSWKLPRDTFNPDGGISFDKKPFNTHTAHPMPLPIATNIRSLDPPRRDQFAELSGWLFATALIMSLAWGVIAFGSIR